MLGISARDFHVGWRSEMGSLRGTHVAVPAGMRQANNRAQVMGSLFLCALLVACAAGDPRFSAQDPAGFWQGLWHGLIVPITFVISLFSSTVEIYERANNGPWYDFGFLVGLMCLGGCGNQSRCRWQEGRGKHASFGGRGRVKIDIKYSGDDDEHDEIDEHGLD